MGHHKKVELQEREFRATPALQKTNRFLLLVGAVLLVVGIVIAAFSTEPRLDKADAGHHATSGASHGDGEADHGEADKAHGDAHAPAAAHTEAEPSETKDAAPAAAAGEQPEGATPVAVTEADSAKDSAHAEDQDATAAAAVHGDAGGHGEAGHGEVHAAAGHDAHGGYEATPDIAEAQETIQELTPHAGAHKPVWLTRLLSNLLLNSFFFLGIAVTALAFIAIKLAANAGWHVLIQRIPEAMAHFMPIGMGLLLIVFLAGNSSLYHWLEAGITDPSSPNYDALITEKSAYLNLGFFLVRSLIFFSLWLAFFFMIRKYSRMEDSESRGEGDVRIFVRRAKIAAVFLVVFGLSFSVAAWDWIMSIEAHWFSTMFGLHMFATCWVSSLAFILLMAARLKQDDLLPNLTASHFHDLGKLMFGFSIFWTYIWFCQFLLIWYANIPEEGYYFANRLNDYPVTFFAAFVLNFILPFFMLLSKGNMRYLPALQFIAIVVIIGHWLDMYNAVMPGTMKHQGSFGLMEIGTFLLFAGIFLKVTTWALSKAPLVPKGHPYLKESLQHEYH